MLAPAGGYDNYTFMMLRCEILVLIFAVLRHKSAEHEMMSKNVTCSDAVGHEVKNKQKKYC